MNLLSSIVAQFLLLLLLCLSQLIEALRPMPTIYRRILEVQATDLPTARRKSGDTGHAAGHKHPISLKKGNIHTHANNDFLVLSPDSMDPFVTVIPNDIFYNRVEKPCVNWLDACSLKGIRDALLHKDNSPYK